ncbi:MAG: ribbon-helix-helix protein, CopG family [Phycisphaeraceae bacterium]|nr:ribbon-helix-helix protein, CopG family [Phycisphaeraceae bacterium]
MNKRKPYWEMTTRELARATEAFDREETNSKVQPLTEAHRKRLQQAKRKRGRPQQGQGARVISLSMERSLLEQVDDQAKAQGISRAQFVAEAIRQHLTA